MRERLGFAAGEAVHGPYETDIFYQLSVGNCHGLYRLGVEGRLDIYRPPLGSLCEITRDGERVPVFVGCAWHEGEGWDIDPIGHDTHGRPVELTSDDLDEIVQQLNEQAEPDGDF